VSWEQRNADFCKAQTDAQMAYIEAEREADRLEKENAKLRELALALADCRNTTCDDCVRWDYPDGGCSLDGVMRELRIEVD